MKKTKRKNIIILSLSILLGFIIYRDFSPSSNFYIKSCKTHIGIDIPSNFDVLLKKSSSHFLTFGDENSSILLKLDTTDFNQVLTKLKTLKPHSTKLNFISTVLEDYSNSKKENLYDFIKHAAIWDSEFDEYGLVLLDDNQTLLYYYHKW